MSAFKNLDFRFFDVNVIVGHRGVVAIETDTAIDYQAWLVSHGYTIMPFDFTAGWEVSTPALAEMFRWEENFGAPISLPRPSLNALNDGFDFNVPAEGGLVFYVTGGDVAFAEDGQWFLGLLNIASSYSVRQLALGRRFFTMLELPVTSVLLNVRYDECRVMLQTRPPLDPR